MGLTLRSTSQPLHEGLGLRFKAAPRIHVLVKHPSVRLKQTTFKAGLQSATLDSLPLSYSFSLANVSREIDHFGEGL
jgi:hypothetical protein